MTKISVSLDDVIPLLDNNFENGKAYKYADISKFLEKNFSKINKNQISGLISRMGTTQIFKKEKSLVGKRYDYIYQGISTIQNPLENTVSDNIIQRLLETIKDLNNMKINLSDPEDFLLLQNQIDILQEQIDNL